MSFSYQGPGAVTERPPHVEPTQPGNWATDPSTPDGDDGTILGSQLLNQIVANLRDLVSGAGVPFDEADDMIRRAVVKLADPETLAITAAGMTAVTLNAALLELHTGKSAIDHTHANATQAAAGFMSIADKAKLDTIAANFRGVYASLVALKAAIPTASDGDWAILTHGPGIDATIGVWDPDDLPADWVDTETGAATNLSFSQSADTLTVESSTGTDAVLPAADPANAGVMAAADKSKLDAVETAATADQTPSEIVAALDTEIGNNAWQTGGAAELALWAAVADLHGDRMNFADGVADPFDDETDVDTVTSIGQSYDAAGDYYGPNRGVIAGTWTMPNLSGSPASALHDGDPSVRASTGSIPGTGGWTIGQRIMANIDFGTVKTVTQIDTQDLRFSAFNGQVEIYVSTVASPAVDGDWTLVANHNNPGTSYHDYQDLGSWQARHVALAISQGGYDNSRSCTIGEFTASGPEDMTVVTNGFMTTVAPSRIAGQIEAVENEAVTANTDFTLEVSRDGGTNWTAATLALRFTKPDGGKVYEYAQDVSGQPAGTSVKLRFKTLNLKDVVWSGHTTKWS